MSVAGHIAANNPAGIPIKSAKIIANTASSAVAGEHRKDVEVCLPKEVDRLKDVLLVSKAR